MCGRFTLTAKVEELAKLFGAGSYPSEFVPSYNIAPSESIAVILEEPEDGERSIELLQWGLVPSWAKDPAIGNKMINARAETAHEKPSYRTAFKNRRCLVLADGFYEWRKTPDGKQPHYIKMSDGSPFTFAGLWETWRGGEDELRTCTILTTEANELMKPIHHRMPVILGSANHAAWLDQDLKDKDTLRDMLRAYPAPEMEAYQVSRVVNRPSNDTPECIRPVANRER